MMWVGFIQSVEGLGRMRLPSPEQEGILQQVDLHPNIGSSLGLQPSGPP